ncbi:hypothetical protein EMIHUDRAFT_221903 [Emiliania huxleyi CCMP1516]|uniref:Poly [ADP-ribose] polymerase n=2 Tax=Emiliania huxleyi TaxID=2903 RepID=A0A0D3HXL0_EMIH1|nr:hypothetical protein EMIHUDRAFT_221903 [Emiliania huxleyi CCMP1516]EOD03745.1 hypothetical protein EMIHUDRAFT_221903 [Emiliania huxleyi CCMP1516]|eukprot:XP_005756174.1 hypothetical protein EMIHUDRAFT_221903 [Emiliania huxleyi CCMP1516]
MGNAFTYLGLRSPDRVPWGPDGGDGGPTESKLVPLSPMSNESLLIKTLLARSCSSAELKTVSRVQNKKLWSAYSHFRDAELIHSAGGDVNEMLLFHGTAERPASDVLAHPQGLDPRFSKGGGFYGHGIYLAEDPSYPIGGRYAHRISGTDGRRVQLLVVRAALGSQQQMGQRISAETREMRMPGVRLEGPPRVLYDSVRGGPHRPFQSGGGDNGCDASIVHVVYESRQMYPAYVIEVEMEMGAEAQHAAMIQKARAALVARQPAAAPHAAPPSTSSHSAAQVPAVRLRFLTDPDSSDAFDPDAAIQKKPPPPKTAASKEKKPPPVNKAAGKEKATGSKQQPNKPPPDSSDEEDQPLSKRKQT